MSSTPKTTDTSSAPNSDQDLAIYVKQLLEGMQAKFEQMSGTIVQRIDEMGNRMDDLEKSIGDLVQQAQAMEQQNKTKE